MERKLTIMKNRIINWLPAVILFLGSFIFFTFLADYVEFYQEKLSLFVFSADYFKESIEKPGSLLVYSGKFLTTFFYYPAAGALIISVIICLVYYLMSSIIKHLTGEKTILFPFITGLLLFVLQANYKYLLFNNLGILLQLAFFLLVIKYLKGWLPVILFPLWYLFTGSFAAGAAIMYIIVLSRRSLKTEWPKVMLTPLVLLVTVWILKEYVLFYTFPELMIYPVSDENTGSQLWLFLITAGVIFATPLVGTINFSGFIFKKQEDHIRRAIGCASMLAAIILISLLKYDKAYREFFTVRKLFFRERYEDITKYIAGHPTSNRLTVYLNNIALSETGLLNDRLFWFPQSPDGQSLFLKWEMYDEVLKIGGYFYYATGMINEAHRWAFENMVIHGITPEDLKMLIKTEIINGNYAMAAKYNSRLKKTFFYRQEAARFENILSSENLIDADPELSLKRKEKITNDFFSITDNPYINIEKAFACDSMNRRIFDYRMAYLMLTEDYPALISGLEKLQTLGFGRIPKHLEEAALVCRMSDSGKKIDFGTLRINPQTEARFGQFLQMFRQYGNNLQTARPFLQQNFGNTFWYWAFYH
jgi:hypothetical protein